MKLHDEGAWQPTAVKRSRARLPWFLCLLLALALAALVARELYEYCRERQHAGAFLSELGTRNAYYARNVSGVSWWGTRGPYEVCVYLYDDSFDRNPPAQVMCVNMGGKHVVLLGCARFNGTWEPSQLALVRGGDEVLAAERTEDGSFPGLLSMTPKNSADAPRARLFDKNYDGTYDLKFEWRRGCRDQRSFKWVEGSGWLPVSDGSDEAETEEHH